MQVVLSRGLLIGGQPFPTNALASILGTWRLQAVHVVVQRPDGTAPYTLTPHPILGAIAETFPKTAAGYNGARGTGGRRVPTSYAKDA
jgi:hypothetical protein